MKLNNQKQVWYHKEKDQLFLFSPWWEIPEGIDLTEVTMNKEKVVWGALVQVGWLIQNLHDIWFGVNFSVEGSFEYVGEL